MYLHCKYGITVNMDTYSLNVLLHIKLWRDDANMMGRLFSKGSYQGPRQTFSVFQFLFDKSLAKDLWNREMHLFSIRIEHDIQYFERVGSSQNNIGHLDT